MAKGEGRGVELGSEVTSATKNLMIWGSARASARPTHLGSCSVAKCPMRANLRRPWEHRCPAQVLMLLCQLQGQGWRDRTEQSPRCSPPPLKKAKAVVRRCFTAGLFSLSPLFCYFGGRIQNPALNQSEL